MNARERIFADAMSARGLPVVAHPRPFWLNTLGRAYTPDFFCAKNQTYYEVSGTRQAHSQGRARHVAMATEYPEIAFQVVNPDGTLYREGKKRKPLPEIAISTNGRQPTPLRGFPEPEKLRVVIKAIEATSGNVSAAARILNVTPGYLSVVIQDRPSVAGVLAQARAARPAQTRSAKKARRPFTRLKALIVKARDVVICREFRRRNGNVAAVARYLGIAPSYLRLITRGSPMIQATLQQIRHGDKEATS